MFVFLDLFLLEHGELQFWPVVTPYTRGVSPRTVYAEDLLEELILLFVSKLVLLLVLC